MFEKVKRYFLNYFKKRKPFAIITDILFWGLQRNRVTKYQSFRFCQDCST